MLQAHIRELRESEEDCGTLIGWEIGGVRRGFLEEVIAQLSLEEEYEFARRRMVGKRETGFLRQREGC